jgi:hypothetical protein
MIDQVSEGHGFLLFSRMIEMPVPMMNPAALKAIPDGTERGQSGRLK